MRASQGRSPTGDHRRWGRRLHGRPHEPEATADVARPRRKAHWKRKSAALLAALTVASPMLAACGTDEGGPTVLRFMGPADGVDQYTAAAQKCSDQADGRYTIEYDVSAKQTDDQELAGAFSSTAEALTAGEQQINDELIGVQGSPAEIGGYYRPDAEKTAAVMRPSQTFNTVVDGLSAR